MTATDFPVERYRRDPPAGDAAEHEPVDDEPTYATWRTGGGTCSVCDAPTDGEDLCPRCGDFVDNATTYYGEPDYRRYI